MRMTRLIGFALAFTLLATAFVSVSQAQMRPGQRVWRFFGQGYGDGYHKQAPGPNSDYYNPYSAHNTELISQREYYDANLTPADSVLADGVYSTGSGPHFFYPTQPTPVQLNPVQLNPVQLNPVQLNPVQLNPGKRNGWNGGFRQPRFGPAQNVDATFEPYHAKPAKAPQRQADEAGVEFAPTAPGDGAWLRPARPLRNSQSTNHSFAPTDFQSTATAQPATAQRQSSVATQRRLFNPYEEN